MFNYSMADLENLQKGTLGRDLADYLKSKNLTLLKNYERHDCKHILFGFEMDESGEAGMQFYFLGYGVYSIPTITSVFAYCIFIPENMSYYLSEYKKGKQKKSEKQIDFDQLDYNELLTQNTLDLRKQFNIL